MVDQLPPPPVPADADLTAFKFMPLEVQRLRRSKAWLICKRKPELAFYMLNLWTASWHELPAGSLEDDEDVLADAAMCSPEKWAKVRRDVMRGWVKHSDGRLYHPVVAEKVMDSWHGRVMDRWRKECDRLRKENKKRADKNLPPIDLPTEPPKISAEHPSESQRNGDGIPAESALKGEGREREREEKGREESCPLAAASTDDPPRDLSADRQQAAAASGGPRAVMASRELVDEAFRRWSVVANDLRIPDVGFLNSTRRAALDQRLAEIGGLNGWDVFLVKIREAKFLIGPEGKPKFWVGLGKLLEPETFSKILEDRYVEHHERASDDERSVAAALAGVYAAGSR